ncbi:MAG: hypothetical protein PUC90_09475 [Prevotella sp.]|nr:hypothetical protein [Prevotella sp.]
MSYNIFSATKPAMPKVPKTAKIIDLVLKNVSSDMREPLVPLLFPLLGSRISDAKFLYPDNTYKELCGQMAHLVADSGANKGQFGTLVEQINGDLRTHDYEVLEKLASFNKRIKTISANKEKPERPDTPLLFPPCDTTKPAFIQNAIALEKAGNLTQYLNLPEVEMANQICGGHKAVSLMMRNIFDVARGGALRATADGVTGDPTLRVNMTISSTPLAARNFYKSELFNGTFGRIIFSYKPRSARSGRIPRQGKYGEAFQAKLGPYLELLRTTKGRFVIPKLNKLIDDLAAQMANLADLADDDVLFDVSKRSLVNAWKAGCILWICNNRTWSMAFNPLVEWLVYRDLWSKLQIFGDMLSTDKDTLSDIQRKGPKNMLDNLPNVFTLTQLAALRKENGKSEEGTNVQIRQWKTRGFVDYDAPSDTYCKTEKYLKTNAR